MSTPTQCPVHIPDACPWGIAVLERESAQVVGANQAMQTIYNCGEASRFTDLFSISIETPLGNLIQSLRPGEQWTGRIFSKLNRHAIGSVEVTLERIEANPDFLYVFTMEHPVVDGGVRFSSRSELKMLRVLLDHTLEYIYFRDLEGHFILCNESFRSAVAVEDHVPGVDNRLDDFVSLKSAAWVRSLDARMLETGKPVVNEVSLFAFQNGTKHWLQLTTVPVRDGDGSTIGSLSVARDISDLKQTESELRTAIGKAHEASRAKGDFLAAMSHEIRTPINGIIGASELCQETVLDDEQRDYLDTVLQCGSTLMGLVNDVLDFSKIEAGQLNLESLNFNPRDIIESVTDEFAQAARSKGIELILGFDPELPEYIMGDPMRVKQVFYNLVGNAVKFTESGEIVIRAEVINRTSDTVRARFSVKDTGIGISKSRQSAIFKSFTQADMSTTRKYGGSGLGLSICKELVQLMDGQISLTSDLGKGACFEFELPFDIPEHPGAEAVPFNAELAGLRVLIVDDNTTNCDLYQQMCAGWGYRSTLAKDGMAGLAELENAVRDGDPYRLILLDQQMPGITGLDLASLIRLRPDMHASRIILLSSSLNRTEAEQAKANGVARALAKPVKRVTLQEVILETFGIKGISQSPSQEVGDVPASKARGLRVLLVDDNPINRDLALRRLQKFGHEVVLATDGYKAVEAAVEHGFDCILMDLQMPGMDGFDATRAIRDYEEDKGLPPAYIVAMTAHAMKGDRERCIGAGMDNYVPKPFRAEELRSVLELAKRPPPSSEPAVEPVDGDASSLGERLGQMSAEDREDVLAIGPIFLETCPKDIRKLEEAVSQKDFDQSYFHAHTIKGVVGIFGSQHCIRLAEKVESAAKSENETALENNVRALIHALTALAKEIELAAP